MFKFSANKCTTTLKDILIMFSMYGRIFYLHNIETALLRCVFSKFQQDILPYIVRVIYYGNTDKVEINISFWVIEAKLK